MLGFMTGSFPCLSAIDQKRPTVYYNETNVKFMTLYPFDQVLEWKKGERKEKISEKNMERKEVKTAF